MAETFGEVFYNDREAAQIKLSLERKAMVSVNNRDKEESMEAVRELI